MQIPQIQCWNSGDLKSKYYILKFWQIQYEKCKFVEGVENIGIF